MIVRIFSEAQYDVPESAQKRMHELDQDCVSAIESGDADRFHATYDQLLALVRTEGEKLADDHLGGSDLMLPPDDISLEEARESFTGEGLLPS